MRSLIDGDGRTGWFEDSEDALSLYFSDCVEGANPQEGGAEGLQAEGADDSQCDAQNRKTVTGTRLADGLTSTTGAGPIFVLNYTRQLSK